jgi:hypothetical protein
MAVVNRAAAEKQAPEEEVDRLRAQVAALENELVDQAAKANEAVALAQERTYWLDRWNLDLNALMARRGAAELRGVVRVARSGARAAKRARKRLSR